jgi:hypothetical protein
MVILCLAFASNFYFTAKVIAEIMRDCAVELRLGQMHQHSRLSLLFCLDK